VIGARGLAGILAGLGLAAGVLAFALMGGDGATPAATRVVPVRQGSVPALAAPRTLEVASLPKPRRHRTPKRAAQPSVVAAAPAPTSNVTRAPQATSTPVLTVPATRAPTRQPGVNKTRPTPTQPSTETFGGAEG
jgi:hypothetical protein